MLTATALPRSPATDIIWQDALKHPSYFSNIFLVAIHEIGAARCKTNGVLGETQHPACLIDLHAKPLGSELFADIEQKLAPVLLRAIKLRHLAMHVGLQSVELCRHLLRDLQRVLLIVRCASEIEREGHQHQDED